MNAQVDNSVLFPPGRIVQGDLYEPQDKDMQGNPLVTKQGQNAGKPRVNYFFALAIPKQGERAWWETTWGQKILSLAQSYWPQGQTQNPRFAWKISDGDDQTPNPEANMRRNCEREGFPGNWIIRLGSGFPTKIYDESGTPLLQPGLVKRGFYVEVFATVVTNDNPQKPGIYLNHQGVAYRAPGKEIANGIDPRQMGFGRAALPAGVTAVPVGQLANIPITPPGAPSAPPGAPTMQPNYPLVPNTLTPGAPQFTPPGAPPMQPNLPPVPGAPATGVPSASLPPAAPPTPVTAHPGFFQIPGANVMPPIGMPPGQAPGAPPIPNAAPPAAVDPMGAPAGFRMTNPNGPRYEAMIASGWNNDLLVQHRHMVRL